MDLPYHKRIQELLVDFPYLEALMLYSDSIKKARGEATVGSHDSNSILAVEIPINGDPSFHRIDAYDSNDVKAHADMLSGKGNPRLIKTRLLLVEDLSPGAIEAIGVGFSLDPHVFYFHLGFDTRRSAMLNLIGSTGESKVPITWYFPNHGPENFISVSIPCDLKPQIGQQSEAANPEDRISADTTYARQAYRPISQVDTEHQTAAKRAFHRISLAFAKTQIKTTIMLTFPTWRRMSRDESGEILDSFGYPLIPRALPLQMVTVPDPATENMAKHRRGVWTDSQWLRVQPLFHVLLSEMIRNIQGHDAMRENALVWAYSKVSFNYHLSSQNDSRSWRDVRALHQSGKISGHISQTAKKFLRDSMTKHTELLDIAKITLDQALEHAVDQASVRKWQRKVDVVIMYQKNRIDMIVKNIADGESFL